VHNAVTDGKFALVKQEKNWRSDEDVTGLIHLRKDNVHVHYLIWLPKRVLYVLWATAVVSAVLSVSEKNGLSY
jgi:hypothetical protein